MFRTIRDLWPRGDAPAAAFCGEDERLSVMASFGLDELEGDADLQRLVGFAARLCETPMAMVSIVEDARQRFLAREGLDIPETPRSTSFCATTMLHSEPLVVPDATEDERFAAFAVVTGAENVRFYAGAPLISSEGAPLGALCVIDTEPRQQGLTDLQREGLEVLADAVMRRLAQHRLDIAASDVIAEREKRLESIIDSVPGIAWSADHKANFDYFNARWKDVTGSEPPQIPADWRDFVHPDDFEKTHAGLSHAVEQSIPFENEFRMRQADGSYRWMLSRAVPLTGIGPTPRWFGTLFDIDEQYRLSESRELLAAELSHRIKNIFAVVSGLVAIKARNHPDAKDFAEDLSNTIKALGLAHDYVRPVEGRRGESLRDLLADLLAPYQDSAGERITVEGADSAIGHRAATPLALIFHELATNSAKYGALSCEEGRIGIVLRETEQDELSIRWEEFSEACEEAVDESHEGFGSRMLRLSIEGQLGGRFERRFSKEGLVCEIVVPRKSLTS
ncbi:sensor histidine kinase [Qipengyuania sp. MTN3-11]|uniref:sensor histidine kinase n=1 Tax=Qipengyuania sp. MTN3-11 TaxID=3056557 RepID=UPI0036F26E7D